MQKKRVSTTAAALAALVAVPVAAGVSGAPSAETSATGTAGADQISVVDATTDVAPTSTDRPAAAAEPSGVLPPAAAPSAAGAPTSPLARAAAPAVSEALDVTGTPDSTPAGGPALDLLKPVIHDAAFGSVRGQQTFNLSQDELNPGRTYVEIQQLVDGRWVKSSGQWFLGTNTFALSVDTDTLDDTRATQLKVSTWDEAGNHASKTFGVTIDRTKPVATLVAPTVGLTASSTVDIRVDAVDANGLNRVTANIYKDGKLFRSGSSAANGATAATHTAAITLPDGEYVVRYNASDLAGNVAQTGHFPIEVDTVAPTIAVKDGAKVVGGLFAAAPSLKLTDAGSGQIDYVVVNGTRIERVNDKYSDLNAGNYAAAQGLNTVVLFDTAGNSTTLEFTLDSVAPSITVKPGASTVNGVYTSVPSFKLVDAGAGRVDYVVVNGTRIERANDKYSDLNAGNYRARQGTNVIEVVDTAGNSTTLEFRLDTVSPEVTGIVQKYEAKEGGRTAVTLSFSEPIDGASLGQGWYGNGTQFTKVYYREKAVTVTFTDLVGHAGSYAFTAEAPQAPAAAQ